MREQQSAVTDAGKSILIATEATCRMRLMLPANQLVRATAMRPQPIRHNKIERRKVLSFTFELGGSDSDKFAFVLPRLVSSDTCSSLTQCTND